MHKYTRRDLSSKQKKSQLLNMVSFPISNRVLMKVLLCGFVLVSTGVGAGGITDNEIDTAVEVATATLQREMTSLKEQLELFEMKQETLQAASEQFRMQSKSAKSKLEAERNRYNGLSSEKESLEISIENKVALALEEQKAIFEDTIANEHVEKRNLLAKENDELSKKLRHTEYQISILEDSMEEKLDEQSKNYKLSEDKILASEQKLRSDISGLTKRLSYSEKQAKSFEASLKNAVEESEAKDEHFQEDSMKRLDEASRWEKRLQKLNEESKDLFEDNKTKEVELIRSKRFHLTLLEKLQTSDEMVKERESEIVAFTAEIEKLSNDLKSASKKLTQSKEDHVSLFDKFENLNNLQQNTKLLLKSARNEGEKHAEINEKLRNELVDFRFELEISQNKTKQTIEEKSEMTKVYTEALEQLTSKNKFLRQELIDMKFELEQSQNETHTSRIENLKITEAHEKALNRLESDGKKLKFLQSEYSDLKIDFETMVKKFKKSEETVENLQKRIEEETTTNEELQKELLYAELKIESSQEIEKQLGNKNDELQKAYGEVKRTLENSENKLLEGKKQYKKSQDHVNMLQKSIQGLEGNVEELIEQLELKVSKNSYLQKSLLESKYNLEESQIRIISLEGQMTETSSTSDEHATVLKIENKKMMARAQTLEQELQESSSSYSAANKKINDLRDQLNATETRSAQILIMYESMTEENDVLSRSLGASEGYKLESVSTNQKLREKNKSFEQCDKDLSDTQGEYTKLLEVYDAAKKRIGETENKVLLQEDAIKELKMRQTELEIISAKREKDIETLVLSEELDTDSINTKSGESKQKSETRAPEDVDQGEKEKKEQRTQKRSQISSFSILNWLDNALYTILRVFVDLVGFLVNGFWQILLSSSFIVRWLVTPIRSFFAFASWVISELRTIHDALVSLFEFEMTFISSLVSSEADATGFVFLIRHSEMFVMFGEGIAVLLCIDFVVSSFLNPIRARRRRPKAKTIHVPKSATASLLRKANNM